MASLHYQTTEYLAPTLLSFLGRDEADTAPVSEALGPSVGVLDHMICGTFFQGRRGGKAE